MDDSEAHRELRSRSASVPSGRRRRATIGVIGAALLALVLVVGVPIGLGWERVSGPPTFSAGFAGTWVNAADGHTISIEGGSQEATVSLGPDCTLTLHLTKRTTTSPPGYRAVVDRASGACPDGFDTVTIARMYDWTSLTIYPRSAAGKAADPIEFHPRDTSTS